MLESDDPGPSPVDEVHQQYLDGGIDEAELERRLGILVDDRATTIRDMCDDVDGIGDELSRELADEFDTVADLQAADAEDLQRVDGIGDKKAEKLLEEL
ncbi:helix-hairpin-helix domain-containing protein [Haloarcula sp. JP-L23]|uniref:helix-hairpin-helix domain-containing protein n=1 Tax=Haloarcula sp. JP-L23 TaxID=2716717 RepID=UPI00140F0B4D|nr:helix-hairpin-helix domain-containing protein [Haloarcula sp. JP-L23]